MSGRRGRLLLALAAAAMALLTLVAAPAAFADNHGPNMHLRNTATGNKCLDADLGTFGNGGKVQVWDCWGGANQQWVVDQDHCTNPGDGFNYCELRNQQNPSMCLDADANFIGNGGVVQIWQCLGTTNQLWAVLTNADGSGHFVLWLLAGYHLVVDLNSACVNQNGCQVMQYTWWNGPNQQWNWVA